MGPEAAKLFNRLARGELVTPEPEAARELSEAGLIEAYSAPEGPTLALSERGKELVKRALAAREVNERGLRPVRHKGKDISWLLAESAVHHFVRALLIFHGVEENKRVGLLHGSPFGTARGSLVEAERLLSQVFPVGKKKVGG